MSPRYTPKDKFFHQAKKDNFVARSAYKLEEIDKRFSLIPRGAIIVDLGCAPGSWIQYLAKVVGPKGAILGYDIEEVRVSEGPRVKTLVADVYALEPDAIRAELARLTGTESEGGLRVDALLSDMAHKLTGVRDTDQAKSMGLVERALFLADSLGVETFVAKFFHGRGMDELVAEVKRVFKDVKGLRPEATRDGSREAFVVARQRRLS